MKTLTIKIFLCLLFLSTSFAYAQSVMVKGKVVDNTNEGLPGVNVLVKGSTSLGTITDLDGNYAITVPNSKQTLVFTYIGYQTVEYAASDKKTGLVVLSDDSKQLDEVVVVGFGKQKKVNLTGAVASVDTKKLESRPITSTVAGLQGVVAGLNITNDNGGAPGQKMNINIRGAGTVGGSSLSSPLILIDGVEGDLSLLNANDIENISVLKDASAASIYGSRAPFGVVLVTTKGGKKGLSVTYNGNLRMQTPINTPRMVDSYTHAIVSNDAARNSKQGLPFGAGMIDKILAYQRGEHRFDSNGKDQNIAWGTGPRGGTIMDDWEWESGTWANVNWYDVYLKDHSYSQEHTINLDGGNDRLTYYVSGRYYDQSGLYNYMQEDYNTLTLNGNFTYKINDRVNFSWSTRLNTEDNDKPSAMHDLFFHNLSKLFPTTPMTMPNGDYNVYSLIPGLRDGGQQVTQNQIIYNQFRLDIEPVKNWKIYVDVANRFENPTYTRQFKKLEEVLPNGETRYIAAMKGMATGEYKVEKGGEFTVYPAAGDNWYETMAGRINYYNMNARTDYELKVKKHYFKILAGTQIEYYSTESQRVGSTNILSDDDPFIPTKSDVILRSNKKGEWTTIGLFTRLNYTYDDRYLVELNYRADGASRFPSNKRWGYFPSFSVGWNVAQEAFFTKIKEAGVDMLKIRGSFGSLGNQNTSSIYPYFQQIVTEKPGYVIGGIDANGILAPDPFSTNITWETIQTTDIGIDIALFSNRLATSFDWYERITKDMIGPSISIPSVYGAKVPEINNAQLKTKGWEWELTWRDRIGKDWNYEVNLSLSDYLTTVTKYDSPDGNFSANHYYSGQVLGEIWGFKVHGIAKSDNEMADWMVKHDQSKLNSSYGGGDFMYEDLNGDKEITKGAGTISNPGDQTIIGNMTPRLQYGIRASLRWKQLDFNMFWQGIGKRDLYFDANTFDGVGGMYDRPIAEEHLDYFRYADHEFGENLDAYYARPRGDDANNFTNDYYLQNGSYLRLKNVTIGYSLPNNTIFKKAIKKARVYVSGENLLTITKLRIYDPESIGLSTAIWGMGKTYPMFQTVSVGLSLTF